MSSAIPQYHEKRMRLNEMDAIFNEYIGGPEVLDVGETLRLMLHDFFYGEQMLTTQQCFSMHDRTIVFPIKQLGLPSVPLSQQQLTQACDMLGEIFWDMAGRITTNILQMSPTYTVRPHECFYKFFPATRELVVYTPVLEGIAYQQNLVAMDGRAVINACIDTLPSYVRNAMGGL